MGEITSPIRAMEQNNVGKIVIGQHRVNSVNGGEERIDIVETKVGNMS